MLLSVDVRHPLLYLTLLTFLTLMTPECEGHGRLLEPPGRGSMWRYKYEVPPNTNDHENNCGGIGICPS